MRLSGLYQDDIDTRIEQSSCGFRTNVSRFVIPDRRGDLVIGDAAAYGDHVQHLT